MPAWDDAIFMICAGIAGGIGQILLTSSYRHADVSVIAPFDYCSLLWALLIGLAGLPLTIVLVGFAVWAVGLFGLGVWAIYRIARGWLRLRDRRPIG